MYSASVFTWLIQCTTAAGLLSAGYLSLHIDFKDQFNNEILLSPILCTCFLNAVLLQSIIFELVKIKLERIVQKMRYFHFLFDICS